MEAFEVIFTLDWDTQPFYTVIHEMVECDKDTEEKDIIQKAELTLNNKGILSEEHVIISVEISNQGSI